MIETRRPLTQAEQRLLRFLLAANKRRQASFPRRLAIAITLTITPLFLVTAIYTRVGWPIAAAVWTAIGFLLAAWMFRSEEFDFRGQIAALDASLQRNEVRDIRINSTAVIAFEEQDDEGAAYAFQLPNDRVVFIDGDDFRASTRFPSSDFSMVETLHPRDRPVIRWIVKHGHRLQPTRTIPADFKKHHELPGHLTIINGRLDDLEHLIKAISAGKA